MSTTKEVQVSLTNAGVLAAQINAAVESGRVVTINGDSVIPFNGTSARSYSTGSLSYRVAAKKPGATREVFVKMGHMAVITSEAPADQGPAPHETIKPLSKAKAKAKAKARPVQTSDGKTTIPATVKGETGYLAVRTVNGHYSYGVTMDERTASRFTPGASSERHAARAEAAGIKIAA